MALAIALRALARSNRKEGVPLATVSALVLLLSAFLAWPASNSTGPVKSDVRASEQPPPVQAATSSPTTSIEPSHASVPKPEPPKNRAKKAAPRESPREIAKEPAKSVESPGPLIEQHGDGSRAAIGDNNILGDNVTIPSPPPRRLTGDYATRMRADLENLPKPRVAINKYENTIEGKTFGDDGNGIPSRPSNRAGEKRRSESHRKRQLSPIRSFASRITNGRPRRAK